MAHPTNVIEISGPTVDIFAPEWFVEARYSSGIVYSVQLLSGMIVTSPEGFPALLPMGIAAQPTGHPAAK